MHIYMHVYLSESSHNEQCVRDDTGAVLVSYLKLKDCTLSRRRARPIFPRKRWLPSVHGRSSTTRLVFNLIADCCCNKVPGKGKPSQKANNTCPTAMLIVYAYHMEDIFFVHLCTPAWQAVCLYDSVQVSYSASVTHPR